MRKKLTISALFLAMFVSALPTNKNSLTVLAKDEANGYHVEEIIRDKFNKSELDSSWRLNDSTVELNYNGLHCISPVGYGSGPVINAVRMGEKTRYEFSIYPNSCTPGGANISFNIGVETPATQQKEPDIDCRVQFWDNQLVFVDYQNNLALPQGDISKNVLQGFSGLYSDLEQTDVALVINRKSNDITEIYAEYKRKGKIVYSSQSTPFILKNPRHPYDYCGFFWDCVEMDLTNFKVYKEDELVWTDNFEEDTLTYSSTDSSKGNFHINNSLNETNVYVSKVSSIRMDATNESIINSYVLDQKENVSTPYEFTYSLKVNELNDNSFYGFGFGLESDDLDIGSKNAIGFVKNDDLTASVVAIRNGVIDNSNAYQIALSKLGIGKYQNYSISLDYANNAYLTINGLTYKFNNIDYYGQFGVGLVNLDASNYSNIELKEVVLMSNTYRKYESTDISNDFKGRKKAADDSEFDTSYINSQKFFLGSGVTVEEDWSTGQTSLTFTNAGPYSAFGPREKFSEFILEFDLEVLAYNAYEYIGVSVGRESIVDVLVQASTTSKAFLLRNDGVTATQVLWGSGCLFENGTDSQESPINIYNKERNKYHMMFVGKNRNLYVYYRDIDAPDTEMAIPRAVIHNINIDGYVSIVGNSNASFSVTNYKIVNLADSCKEESNITLREGFNKGNNISYKLSLDSMSKVKDDKLVMNNSTVSTVNQNLYEIIRFTTYELDDSLQIMLSQGKKIVFDAKNNQIIINEDGEKTRYDCGDMNLKNIKGKRFEITVFGDEISIGYKGYYDPQDKMNVAVITHKVKTPILKDNITFSANGKVILDDLYLFALDNTMRSETINYEDDPDNLDIWEVKKDFDPTKVYNYNKNEQQENTEKKGCKGSIGGFGLMAALLGLVSVLKRKED